MEKKINIAEILKDCPKGMELYSTIYGTVYFEGVRDTGYAVLIDVKTSCNTEVQFYPDGKLNTYYSDSEMTLFPSKDVRNWKGFHRPFEDGDIVAYDSYYKGHSEIFIFKDNKENNTLSTCYLMLDGDELYIEEDAWFVTRFATEEEKEKLFDSIKANGFYWNKETKTLEKLINKNKFVIGATVTNGKIKGKICLRDGDSYVLEDGTYIFFNEVHNWELVPDKFDITTLIPFESKVLARDSKNGKWIPTYWGFYDKDSDYFPYKVIIGRYSYCIPYEGNEHLLGTANDCDEYYKTW